MGIDLILTVLSAAISLSLPLGDRLVRRIAEYFGIIQPPKVESYSQQLRRLTETLSKSSSEVDAILEELTRLSQEKEELAFKLENRLKTLEEDEKNAKQRIQDLQNIPIPVAEHFAKITEPGERRSARRDYILFGAGVVVSTVITVILSLLGVGN